MADTDPTDTSPEDNQDDENVQELFQPLTEEELLERGKSISQHPSARRLGNVATRPQQPPEEL